MTTILDKLNNQEKLLNYKKIDSKRDVNLGFYFSDYRSLKEPFKVIYYRNLSIDEAERLQDEFDSVLSALKEYNPRKPEYKTAKNNLEINAKNVYDGKEMIINAFKDKILPLDSFKDFDEGFDENEDRVYTSEDFDGDYKSYTPEDFDKTRFALHIDHQGVKFLMLIVMIDLTNYLKIKKMI